MHQPSASGSVVALAGRRIDEPGTANPRFPLANVELVKSRIRQILEKGVSTLICSAACGADLLALGIAGELGIRRRVMLPFDRNRFRETSVVDRPGDWGELYDRIVAEVETKGDLIELSLDPADPNVYAPANRVILDEAVRLASANTEQVRALIVWESETKPSSDFTAQFFEEALSRHIHVTEISVTRAGK